MASPVADLRRLSLDLPPTRLADLVGRLPDAALLESAPGFGAAGRWSLYAARPRLVFEATDDAWTLAGEGPRRSGTGTLAALTRLLERHGLAGPESDAALDPGLPPFRGGLIGHVGYDLAPQLEQLPRRAPRDSALPDIRLGLYDTFVAHDHQTGTSTLWAVDLPGLPEGSAGARLQTWRADLERPTAAPRPARLGPIRSNFSRTGYEAAVDRALEYIAAGDIFQVNLSQRFEARGTVDPLDLYLRLRDRSPAPFAAYLGGRTGAVVSASPEWFYRVQGREIVTRPIKGTRPRGSDPAQDAALADELRQSLKDRAELTMIIDLERNDLGRVCEFGTVQVTGPPVVESFAQVHHMVATVAGRLRADAGPVEVLRAMFPGGSITGAPKIRAMQIIDELEPTRRGVYTGMIGYFTAGASAFNIAIRTLVVEGDRVCYQVGGGIVADSQPAAEFEETLHKGRGLREVLDGWTPPA